MNKLKRIIAAALILANAAIFCLPVAAQANKTSKKTTPSVFENPGLVKKYQQTISPETLASRLYFLASDYFEGRETGARGQRLAAQYLASQYRLLGLTPKGTGNQPAPLSPAAYFQSFPVYRETPQEARLEISVGGSKIASSIFSAEQSDDLAYFQSGGAKNASGSLVFAGYGIADDKLGYNDLAALAAAGVSINDKWVLILADEPLADATTSRLPTADKKPSFWSSQLLYKRAALLKAGRPKGILLVRDTSPRYTGTFAANAANASANARQIGLLSLYETTDIPQTYAISTKLANQLLASSGKTVEALQQQINQNLKPAVFELKDVNVSSTVERSKPLETENVLGFIEGSDPKLKDEVILISAHYDHLGINPALKGDQIYNGAADDGSGTVATLELAKAFMQAKRDGFAPRRSLLFVNFVGEEKGILGSSLYAYNAPVVPLEKTVANINLDGVGGIDAAHPTKSKNYIYLAAAEKLSDELLAINKQVHKLTGSSLELSDGNGKGFSSDNQGFENLRVPFLYYSTGRTEHYHQPGDGPETIDYEHLARVTQLIFAAVWQVANQNEKISSIDRRRLKQVGYVCPPCPFNCDTEAHDHAGVCPVCGMILMPKYEMKSD
jgi:hypothetical protein